VPYEEIFMGSNVKTYKHKYYIAYFPLKYDASAHCPKFQKTEVSKMAWFSLIGLLIYPIGIAITSAFGMDKASTLIADIAPTYFASIAVLVSAFFGADALKGKGKKDA